MSASNYLSESNGLPSGVTKESEHPFAGHSGPSTDQFFALSLDWSKFKGCLIQYGHQLTLGEVVGETQTKKGSTGKTLFMQHPETEAALHQDGIHNWGNYNWGVWEISPSQSPLIGSGRDMCLCRGATKSLVEVEAQILSLDPPTPEHAERNSAQVRPDRLRGMERRLPPAGIPLKTTSSGALSSRN